MPAPSTRPGKLLGRPFRGSTAIAAGLLTKDQLKGASWRRVFRDIYVNARLPDDHILRVKAAALILPAGAAVSGRSAALLWGAKMGDIDGPVEVRSPKRFGPVRGLAIRTGALDPSEVTVRWGLPVCTVSHTAWEIARELPELDAVEWIDALANARRTSRKSLVEHAGAHRGEMGSVCAGATLALCDPRSESPPESDLRVHLHRAGFPAPVPQYHVVVDGIFIARVDLAWPQMKLAIEYDGQWHSAGDQMATDRARLRALNREGWYVFHVTARDMSDIDGLLGDLADVMRDRMAA